MFYITAPSLAPVLDDSQPIYVNNQTAMIKWYVDKGKCNKLNGIVTGFHVILEVRNYKFYHTFNMTKVHMV